MKRGDSLTLTITDVAYGGAGIARHEGLVVFVPFTIPGETVQARIVKATRNWMTARVTHIAELSADRVEPPCPLFMRCGGCTYQHIAYPRQLEIKAHQVSEALRRIGKFTEPPVEPARPSPLAYSYRNRITVHVVPPLIGFRGTDPREVINVEECLLAEEPVNAALAALRSKKRLRPGPATLRAGPAGRGFRQVNDAAADVLAAAVSELAGRGEVLIDAYCGAGFFAKKLRHQFTHVIGLDWDERSIESARADAGPSEVYHAGDAAELLPDLLTQTKEATVLIDPPAQGLAAQVITTLLESRPARVVYVSCDPATLARDLAKLRDGYDLQRAIPVDMFPQTASIETACLLVAKIC
jgi:tRNA/tmRNA/rRNA uracil-C5-methylase (TrmA/RlmC/RlmD family)